MCWRGRDLKTSPRTKVVEGTISFPSSTLEIGCFWEPVLTFSIYRASTHASTPCKTQVFLCRTAHLCKHPFKVAPVPSHLKGNMAWRRDWEGEEITPHTSMPPLPAAKRAGCSRNKLWPCACSCDRESNCRQLSFPPTQPTNEPMAATARPLNRTGNKLCPVYSQQVNQVIAVSWAKGIHDSATIGGHIKSHIGDTPGAPGSAD